MYIKIKKVIVNFFATHRHVILYFCGIILGVTLMILSFFLKDNWVNVLSGIGTGLLTSLIVSISINHENDRRHERKLLNDKKLVLGSIIDVAIDVYCDIVYRINEFTMFSDMPPKSFYGLYDEFSLYNQFEDYLKELNIDSLSKSERERLKKLFNIGNYRIDHLVAELKRFPKHDYYLKGLLTKDEFNGLTSNVANDIYMNHIEHIDEFWDDGIINYEKCIYFLRLTLYICSQIIGSIQYCRDSIIKKEEDIKTNLGDRYFYEIYSHSSEYIEKQLEEAQARDEYYEAHPEEYEKLLQSNQELQNETSEDKILKDLYYSICGFSAYSIDDLLSKLDYNSKKVLLFFTQDDIHKALKRNLKKRRAIKKRFGNDYLQKAKKINDEIANINIG